MDFIFVVSTVQQVHLIIFGGMSNPTDFIFQRLKFEVDAGSVISIKCIGGGLCC